jgi:hypothetical protein
MSDCSSLRVDFLKNAVSQLTPTRTLHGSIDRRILVGLAFSTSSRFTCTYIIPSLTSKHAYIFLLVPEIEITTAELQTAFKRHHSLNSCSSPALQPPTHQTLTLDKLTRHPPTMNRLFGAKNNAPKPTLTSAISNVRPPTPTLPSPSPPSDAPPRSTPASKPST